MIEKPSTEKLEHLAHELKLEGRTEESDELFQWLSYIDWLWDEMQGMSERSLKAQIDEGFWHRRWGELSRDLIEVNLENGKLKKLISELESEIENARGWEEYRNEFD